MKNEIDWEINAGDGAFAGEQGVTNQRNGGLTKREYIAAMAMQGLLSNFSNNENTVVNNGHPFVHEIAVKCADDLLRELSKRQIGDNYIRV